MGQRLDMHIVLQSEQYGRNSMLLFGCQRSIGRKMFQANSSVRFTLELKSFVRRGTYAYIKVLITGENICSSGSILKKT